MLGRLLLPTDDGLEYGCGRSTEWFAQRTRSLVSVEHDDYWFARVDSALKKAAVRNVVLKHVPATGYGDSDRLRDAYVAADPALQPASLDYVLVDGLYRDLCALNVLPLIRPSGMLIIDNVNWYLPSTSVAPASVRHPASIDWQELGVTLSTWRSIWTSNGVTDTAIWMKPLEPKDDKGRVRGGIG
jgi:predicted O-methyltransferase YrrM